MVIPKGIERIKKMQNGEKVKCPKCDTGYISAVGKPETAHAFKCDGCGRSIVLTMKPT